MNNKNISQNKKGFIAMTLVLTISILLLVFSFIDSIEIGYFFDMTIIKEYRLMSYYKASNCIDHAILNLTHDYFYRVSTSTKILDLDCYIDLVKNENNYIDIKTHSNYKNILVKRKRKIILYDNKIEVILVSS